MGIQTVKTMSGMAMANQVFWKRAELSKRNILIRLARINLVASKKITDEVKFRGTLTSMIELNQINQFKVQVISSAPHSFEIEMGEPSHGKGQYVSFDEDPLLEMWVKNKLMKSAPYKAKYFLNRRSVKIGDKGFPFRYPKGLRFMENGIQIAFQQSGVIVSEELSKLT